MRSKLLYLIPLTLALASGIWLAQTRQAEPPPAAREALWQMSFPDVHGQRQPLSQWRGQVVVLNFWASWCAPCREEMPDFDAVRAQTRMKGVEFVGIAIDGAENVERFLARQPVGYPILVGGGDAHALARQLGNPEGALPYTVVVDRNGEVAFRHLGRLPRATLESALRNIGA
jgi:thiol-disulfide isomerase/thioredoxin